MPVPNSDSSWMIITVLAGLPAAVLSTCRLAMAISAHLR